MINHAIIKFYWLVINYSLSWCPLIFSSQVAQQFHSGYLPYKYSPSKNVEWTLFFCLPPLQLWPSHFLSIEPDVCGAVQIGDS